MKKILDRLYDLQDLKYKNFQEKLVPDTKLDIIGVRVPIIRKLSKEKELQEDFADFLCRLPHRYYDEYILHSILISDIKSYEEVIIQLDKFLPYIDNWAVCDILSPKIFKKHTDKFYPKILEYIHSTHTYTVRFAIITLLSFYMDKQFDESHLCIVRDLHSDEYYINMARAWYFSVALVKQYESSIKIIQSKTMDSFTHNKSIQKAIESYRITDDKKKYLRTLKI